MMVWDDRTSVSVLGRDFMGFMETFDEQCRQWFKDNAPKVKCEIVTRQGHSALSMVESTTAATCFSHHQARALPCRARCAHTGMLLYTKPVAGCPASLLQTLHQEHRAAEALAGAAPALDKHLAYTDACGCSVPLEYQFSQMNDT